jgi:ketol-acid reductoisomerase
VDVIMVAPKGPGTLLRSLFLEGKGLPALLAVHEDATGNAERMALAWAAGIGAERAAVIKTTFAMETETDLFGEQTVLCGGVTALVQAAFETLTAAGYPPEFAYVECDHELKQIVDLIYAGGVEEMRRRISNTAEYGDLTRGPRLVSAAVREVMKQILDEVRDGRFAEAWVKTYQARGENFREGLVPSKLEDLERAGRAVRQWMPWLRKQV